MTGNDGYQRTERPLLPSRRDRKMKIDRAEKHTRRLAARARKAQERAEKPRKKRGCFSTFLLLIGLLLMGYSLYQLGTIAWKYYKADREYSKLSDHYADSLGDNGGNGDGPLLEQARRRIIDFDGLKKVNSDIIGWIYIPDTRIDYPVAHTDNNDFYLHNNYEKMYSESGCVFLDSHNKPDFSELDSHLFGHHMRDRSMFGQLPFYRKPEWAKTHQHIFLYTPTETKEYIVAETGVISPNQLKPPKTEDPKARFITMVTCEYDFQNARYFVRGSLDKIYSPGGVLRAR